MADAVDGDLCTEQDHLVPATMECYVQREHDRDVTPQDVRCCAAREGQAAVVAALMRSTWRLRPSPADRCVGLLSPTRSPSERRSCVWR